MIDRNTTRVATDALAAAALLIAARTAEAAHASRGPAVGTTAGAPTTQSGHASPNGRYGRGYGRGWCYWHPYACCRY